MSEIITESAVAAASIALSPTRTRVNPSSFVPEPGQALFVTMNEAGRVRALLADEGAFEPGQAFEAILGARKAKLGTLTIVADKPDANLPLRLIG